MDEKLLYSTHGENLEEEPGNILWIVLFKYQLSQEKPWKCQRACSDTGKYGDTIFDYREI